MFSLTINNRRIKFDPPKDTPLSHVGLQGTLNYIICQLIIINDKNIVTHKTITVNK